MDLVKDASLDYILFGTRGKPIREASQQAYKDSAPEQIAGRRGGKQTGCKRGQQSAKVVAWQAQSETSDATIVHTEMTNPTCGVAAVTMLHNHLSTLCMANANEHLHYPEFDNPALDFLSAKDVECLQRCQVKVRCKFKKAGEVVDDVLQRFDDQSEEDSAVASKTKTCNASNTSTSSNTSTTTGNAHDASEAHDLVEYPMVYFQPMFLVDGRHVKISGIEGDGRQCAWHFCVEDIKKLRAAEDKGKSAWVDKIRGWFSAWRSNVKVEKGSVPVKPKIKQQATSSALIKFGMKVLAGGLCFVIVSALYAESAIPDFKFVVFWLGLIFSLCSR
jgi:hypothetical protein